MADPAFSGFVESTLDALLVIEGCRQGVLPKIARRLQEFEKRALVVSGAVFVFDEQATGIKRWTDGLSWSPSRTLGNFLVYRELDKKVIPSDRANGDSQSTPSRGGSMNDGRSMSETSGAITALDRTRERALVGSLTSSYRFRPDGLVKKTISLGGLHMIGYYKIDDVTSGRLRTPSSLPELASLEISPQLLIPSGFRVPPQTETGPDGHLRYKGEPDSPIAGGSTSDYSAGYSSATLDQQIQGQSRPTTSASDSNGPLRQSPRMTLPPLLPLSPQLGARHAAPYRTNNRYDPYPLSRSPSLSSSYSPHSNYLSQSTPPLRNASVSQYNSFPQPQESVRYDRIGDDRTSSFGDRVRPNSSTGSVNAFPLAMRDWPPAAQQLTRVQSEQTPSSIPPFYPRHSSFPSLVSDLDHQRGPLDTRPLLPPIGGMAPQPFSYQPPSPSRLPRSLTSPTLPYQQSYAGRPPSNGAAYSASGNPSTFWQVMPPGPNGAQLPRPYPALPRPPTVPAFSSQPVSPALHESSHGQSPLNSTGPQGGYGFLPQSSFPNYSVQSRGDLQFPMARQQYNSAPGYSREGVERNGNGNEASLPRDDAQAQLERQRQLSEGSLAMRRRLSEREDEQIRRQQNQW